VLTGVSLAVLAAVVGGATGLLVLAVAATALALARGLRPRRATAVPAPSGPGPDRTAIPSAVAALPVDPEDLTIRLRRLHEDHVERVNMALAEGREDLVRELSDSYMDQSLTLITSGGQRSPDHFHIQ
jgi:hypothetical protein